MKSRRLTGWSMARSLSAFSALAAGAALLTACNSTTPEVAVKKTKSKEYFAESEYGVKASPRVTAKRSSLPRGGGRYQVGKPYQIKGNWYHPKEDPDYEKVGAASWYGDAFHGRLTANGEVYDMTHLSAAHPTMPLPSYARVTNLDNGSSVLVRVNDRGPFAHNRIIDLSKRAAQLLDYHSAGVAEVRVEYVGPAPLEGRDDEYLLASYRPNGVEPDPGLGLPSGVMVAMNGPTPTATLPGVKAASAFSGQPGLTPPQPVASSATFQLPATGPLVPERPLGSPQEDGGHEVAFMSYADQRASAEVATDAFDNVLRDSAPFISLGTFDDKRSAQAYANALSSSGTSRIEVSSDSTGKLFYSVTLTPRSAQQIDDALRAAWDAGAQDAFIVR